MLKISDLSYRYQSRDEFTLQHIDITLEDGEMLLLAGRSGCGKSTLIKAISGLLGSEGRGELHGSICLNGENITDWAPEKIGLLVGTVYQSPDDQLFAMTVADEVGFALENQGLKPEIIAQRVSVTLKMVGLEGLENSSIHKLSGGQRQRLALASILVTKPRLLILDEPVSQMNPQGVQSFMQLLQRLNQEEHLAVLMIEHRVNELYSYFKRLAVMCAGKIIYDGSITAAWRALTGRDNLGLREPQLVKLCRELNLSELTTEQQILLSLLRKECVVSRQDTVPAVQMEKMALLEVRRLFYTYPGSSTATLQDLSFNLYKDEIVALMGFNGAGKSTLLNLLGGLTDTAEGIISLEGLPIRKALGSVGYLRQEPDLMLLADTVREELCWNNGNITPMEVAQLLKRLNLELYVNDFPLALSKGQRLRVILGAILGRRPKLLLLDEPTTGQDEQSLNEIKNLLKLYKCAHGCVLICTHDVELAAEIADRVIVLNKGQIIADAPVNEVLTNEALLSLGGLTASPLLQVCAELQIPVCTTVKEVKRYVRKAAVGGL